MKAILTTILALFIGVQFIAAQDKAAQPAKESKTTTTTTTTTTQQAAPTTQPATQQAPANATPVTPATPKSIVWNETVHDFAKVKQNDPAEVTFTFKNNGQAPVVVTAARSSCGCTVAEYTKEPVKPGASGTVKATYNSARIGAFTKTVTVTFEGYDAPDVLTIKGEVEGTPPSAAPTTPTTQPTTPAQPTETPKK
jgi:hypothetical protein